MREPVPYPDSLCHACAHKRDVKSARSHFLLCSEGRPPKYAPQPVRGCPFFTPAPPAARPEP